MDNRTLQTLVEEVSKDSFHRPFLHQARFNNRLRTTGGRYLLSSHDLEFNPLMLTEFDLANLIGVIKHELVHYHLHLQGRPYQHKDQSFKRLLADVGGLRYAPPTSRTSQQRWHYRCERGHDIYRQRRIKLSRYRCGRCRAPLHLFN